MKKRKSKTPKVEKVKNHEKWRDTKMKMLICYSFYNKKWSPPRNLRNSNEKTTVINGSLVQKVSPAYDFLKNSDSYIGFVRESGFSLSRDQSFR